MGGNVSFEALALVFPMVSDQLEAGQASLGCENGNLVTLWISCRSGLMQFISVVIERLRLVVD
jgi:hypothetical protein